MNTGAVRGLAAKLPQHPWAAQRDCNPHSGETWSVPGVVQFMDTQLVRLECERDRHLAEYLAQVCPFAVIDLLDHHDAAMHQMRGYLDEIARLKQLNAELRQRLEEAEADITHLSELVHG